MSKRLALGVDAPSVLRRRPVEAVVALGANLGDRAATMAAALDALRRLPLVAEVRASEPIESVAVTLAGPDDDAPRYLNAVAILRTSIAPSLLLRHLHAIEERHGRERRERWGDRTLDLDLVQYGDIVSGDERLLLPHPRAAERDFVLAPWLSIDPDAELVGHGRVDVLLADLQSRS